MTAQAPSFSPDEFPAVTLPSFLKAARNFDKPSIDVDGFMNSSFANTTGSPFRCGIFIVIIFLTQLLFF